MKKVLLLVLATVFFLAVFTFACAEEEYEVDLFELWDYGGESLTWIGSAIPVSEGIVMTSPAVLPENTENLAVSDGREYWEIKIVLRDRDNAIALILFDPAEKPSRYGVWQLLPYGEDVTAASCYVRYADGMGSRINRAVLSAETGTWRGRRSYVLSLTDPVPVGSPVLTPDGQLAAIVIAEWAEGINRVLALPPEEISNSLTEIAGLLNNLPDWGEPPDGLTVTLSKNVATIDWKDMILPDKAEDEKWYLVIADTGNNYLNFFDGETEERSVSAVLTPGRVYLAGMIASASPPDSIPQTYLTFSVPPAQKLTDYDFHPVLTAVAEAPEGGLKDGEEPVPVIHVTEEMLISGRIYFYSHSTYKVDKEIRDKTLLVCLTDPEGINYRWESGWIYSPEYMERDIWFVSLEETGLSAGLRRNGYSAGVYQMAYYVDGDLADLFEFELIK